MAAADSRSMPRRLADPAGRRAGLARRGAQQVAFEALPGRAQRPLRRGGSRRTANHCHGNAATSSGSQCRCRASVLARARLFMERATRSLEAPAAPPAASISQSRSRLPSGCARPLGLENHVVIKFRAAGTREHAGTGVSVSLGPDSERPPHRGQGFRLEPVPASSKQGGNQQ